MNRLAELKKRRNSGDGAVVVEMESLKEEKKSGGVVSSDSDTEYIKKFEVIKSSLKKIKQNTDAINALNNKANVEVKETEQKGIMNELDELMLQTKKEATKTKDLLTALEDDCKKYEKANPGSTNAQIRSNLLATHTRHFSSAMKDYQTASENFKESVKQRMARQARIVKEDITEEEVQQIIESDKPGEFIKEYMGLSDVLVDAVAELEERHERMRKIEQGVKEILDLFQDLATLVELQQEHLDNIEQNVARTKEYTKKAEQELIQAQSSQRSSRKWLCWGFIILLIILVCIVLGIVIPQLS